MSGQSDASKTKKAQKDEEEIAKVDQELRSVARKLPKLP